VKVSKKQINKNVVIYQAKSGAIELRGDFTHETVWASQAQIASIFGVTPQNITTHLKNIYIQKELSKSSTCKESLQVQNEGGRQIERKIKEYNLEVLIAIGYRINSVVGTSFRQWATKTLRSHIVDGYTINKSRVAKNYETFLKAVEDVKILLPSKSNETDSILELISLFADTWLSLDSYDREVFDIKKPTKKKVSVTAKELQDALALLKNDLVIKNEASELFALEKQKESLEGIIGNVFQSFGGKHVYESVEEKAAHLIYFIVKNHPFIDGNKRSGAYAFIWFLERTKKLNRTKITPQALTAITLLTAESNPKDKEKIVKLIASLI
jgi:prophage maintenance system killer protein